MAELAEVFLRLGLTSFGGPVAHLGYFQREFVERRGWLGASEYADLVALCQFLPGPASSQVVFALGHRERGLAGALVASLGFLLPSAVLMIALGCGAAAGWADPSWLRGLMIAAMAVVGHAVLSMARSLCPDLPRGLLAAGALLLVLFVSSPWIQLVALAIAGAAGLALRLGPSPAGDAPTNRVPRRSVVAGTVFGGLLLATVLLPAAGLSSGPLSWCATFYRAGSLVFGGGHVVLPWLREGMVGGGWLAESAFLAGYGAAQTVPGPLFSFAGYLGAASHPGPLAPLAGVVALFLLFLPAWLSVYAALPVWAVLKRQARLAAAMAGANAGVVGLLAAVLLNHIVPDAVHSSWDLALGAVAFGALCWRRVPVLAVVVVCALAGVWLPS